MVLGSHLGFRSSAWALLPRLSPVSLPQPDVLKPLSQHRPVCYDVSCFDLFFSFHRVNTNTIFSKPLMEAIRLFLFYFTPMKLFYEHIITGPSIVIPAWWYRAVCVCVCVCALGGVFWLKGLICFNWKARDQYQGPRPSSLTVWLTFFINLLNKINSSFQWFIDSFCMWTCAKSLL